MKKRYLGKSKKFIAGFLSAAMVMSTAYADGSLAFADEVVVEASAEQPEASGDPVEQEEKTEEEKVAEDVAEKAEEEAAEEAAKKAEEEAAEEAAAEKTEEEAAEEAAKKAEEEAAAEAAKKAEEEAAAEAAKKAEEEAAADTTKTEPTTDEEAGIAPASLEDEEVQVTGFSRHKPDKKEDSEKAESKIPTTVHAFVKDSEGTNGYSRLQDKGLTLTDAGVKFIEDNYKEDGTIYIESNKVTEYVTGELPTAEEGYTYVWTNLYVEFGEDNWATQADKFTHLDCEKVANTYTIKLDPNGVKNSPFEESIEATYNQEVELPTVTDSVEGKKFLGWSTTVNGEVTTETKNFTTENRGVVTLYAQWEDEVEVASVYTLTVKDSKAATETTEHTSDNGATVELEAAGKGVTVNFVTSNGEEVEAKTVGEFDKWTLQEDNDEDGTLVGNRYTFGAGNDTVEAVYESNVVTLPTLTKAGYKFKGWKVGDTDVVVTADTFEATEDVTLTAQWEKSNNYANKKVRAYVRDDHEVGTDANLSLNTFQTSDGWREVATPIVMTDAIYDILVSAGLTNANGNTIVFPESLLNTDVKALLAEGTEKATKDNYDLKWYRIVNRNDGVHIDGMNKVQACTVHFVTNGGTAVEDRTVGRGLEVAASDLPTTERTGYEFAGWSTDEAGENMVTGSYIIPSAAEATLYAQWIASEDTSFHVYVYEMNEDGTYPETPQSTYPVALTTGAEVTASDFSHYATGNYYTLDLQNSTAGVVRVSEDGQSYINVYFARIGFTVTPVAETGIASVSAPQTVIYGNTARVTAELEEGYDFLGWYDRNGNRYGQNLSLTIAPSSNLTLYARAVEKQFEVVMTDNSGTHSSGTMNYSESYTLPAGSDQAGHTFTNWVDGAGNVYPAGTVITNLDTTLNLTAVYTVNQYTVTYVENGGSEVTDATVDYNTQTALPTTIFVGYTFQGWSADGTVAGIVGTAGANITVTDNMTLQAVWTINSYDITFNTEGGSTVPAESRDHGTVVNVSDLPTTTRPGYIFQGWSTDGTVAGIVTGSITITDDTTLTAVWTAEASESTTQETSGSEDEGEDEGEDETSTRRPSSTSTGTPASTSTTGSTPATTSAGTPATTSAAADTATGTPVTATPATTRTATGNTPAATTTVDDTVDQTATTSIGDAEVPLADGADDNTDETAENAEVTAIDDEEVPLSAKHDNCWVHWFVLISTIIFGLYSLALGLLRHKEIKDAENDNEKSVENNA